MDTITHAVSGAVLGRATAGVDGTPLSPRRRMVAGFLAAAFPDSDFILRLFVDPLTFLALHRGVTHSLIMLPLWAILLAWIFSRLFADHRWQDYLPLTAMALAIHIMADVITAYGTMILAPFSSYKVAIPTTFIIDPWFSAILLAGLAGSLLWRASRWPAVLSLVFLAGYVGFQGLQLQHATRLGELYAREQGLEEGAVQALPQPLSPFNWKIVVAGEEQYRMANVNLRRQTALEESGTAWWRRVRAAYRPVDDLRWHQVPRYGADPQTRLLARQAWDSETLAGFRDFAQLPALLRVDHREGTVCAWFVDLRFTLGEPEQFMRAPFRYGACNDGDGQWQLDRL